MAKATVATDDAASRAAVQHSAGPDLEAEGSAREIVRRVQEMLKEMGPPIDAEIRVEVALDERLRGIVASHGDPIAREARAKHLAFTADPKGKFAKDRGVEEQAVRIGMH